METGCLGAVVWSAVVWKRKRPFLFTSFGPERYSGWSIGLVCVDIVFVVWFGALVE